MIGSSASIVAEKSCRSKAARPRDTAGTTCPDGYRPAREVFDLPNARLQRCVVAGYSVSERDMHVGKGHAGMRECGAREVAHHAPGMAVSRMPGKFPSP